MTAGAAPIDDAALLARAQGGDERARAAAFEELFVRLRAPVLALCGGLCGNRADAEDALQETFLAVHGGLQAFRGESAVSTWVYRIALRVSLRVKSRRAREHGGSDDRGASNVAQDGSIGGVHPRGGGRTGPASPTSTAGSHGIEGALQARSEGRRVLAAMARLPAEQRAVLALFAVEDLKHREIAEVLGVPEGTVWSRLHLARKKLAAELEGGLPAEGK